MPYPAHVVHHSRGRIRLRIPDARGLEAAFARFRDAITPLDGIASVETNPRTGSVLIHYQPEEMADIEEALQQSTVVARQFSIVPPEFETAEAFDQYDATLPETESHLVERLTNFVAELEGGLKRVTNNELDLAVLAPAGVALLGILGSRKRSDTPLWVSLCAFAIHSFITVHEARQRRQFDRHLEEETAETTRAVLAFQTVPHDTK